MYFVPFAVKNPSPSLLHCHELTPSARSQFSTPLTLLAAFCTGDQGVAQGTAPTPFSLPVVPILPALPLPSAISLLPGIFSEPYIPPRSPEAPPMRIPEATPLLHALASGSRRVLLTGPADADGDSLGAGLALAEVLRRTFPGLTAEVVYHYPVPERYRFLPGAGGVIGVTEASARGPYDLAILLDGARHRLGDVGTVFDAATSRVLIDHHRSGSPEGYDLAILEPDMAATCEMIYDLIIRAPFSASVDAELAVNLYAGIIFDTGTFRYSCTAPSTLRVAAALVETGIDFQAIVEKILLDTPFEATVFRGRVLTEARMGAGGRMAWAVAPLSLFRETGSGPDATEGIINHLVFIEGVDVAMFFVERERGGVKVSFRSRGVVNVAQAARHLHPTGGGHDRASGVTLAGTLEEVVPRVTGYIGSLLPTWPVA